MEDGILKFENIPKCFYDHTLDGADWEQDLIDEMIKLDGKSNSYMKNNGSDLTDYLIGPFGEATDIFGRTNEESYRAIMEDLKESEIQYKKNAHIREQQTKEYRESPDRINKDKELRLFLYNKGEDIPTQEMDREVYLRERLSSVERKNLVEMVRGLTNYSIHKRDNVAYAIFGIGTSVFGEKYFSDLEKNLMDSGFDRNSKIEEKAHAILDQGMSPPTNWKEYVEMCYNMCSSVDGKYRPKSEEKFDELKAKEQVRYTEEKTVGEVLDNRGEDLDFAICLEEIYGENTGLSPHRLYSDVKDENGKVTRLRDVDILRRNFVGFLESEGYKFKEEIEMLSGADYVKSPEGGLERKKDIKENTCNISTYRVFVLEGREMHFYFQNQMADMKVKQEKVFNSPFVQIERQIASSASEEFGFGADLEAAIKNGEETGVFENPLLLKWRK